MFSFVRVAAVLSLFCVRSFSQVWDPLLEGRQALKEATHDTFRFNFEERTRWEERYGVNFGRDPNQQDMLGRIRIGAQWDTTPWLRFSAMGQDVRVPFFGPNAPNNLRDTMDLHEAYVELRANKQGFGGHFGRSMVSYGETRLIGIPEWANVARTFDEARVYYRTPKHRLEVLMISPVKIRPDAFNVPDLGDRIWGTYNTFSKLPKGISVDVYALRHSQNKIGGWTGAGTLGTNSFGGRFFGPLPYHFRYTSEGIFQTGHMGERSHRAYAWHAGISKQVTLWQHPWTLVAEYKQASGTKVGSRRTATFDQLYPANHDKFGHQDIFGWRNMQNFRSQATWAVTKAFNWNFMYSNIWLMSATDSLYNGQGRVISTSPTGIAGRHVGQDLDTFITYKAGPYQFGAGVGHFFKGEFVTHTTPGVYPRYFYIFQQYSF